jgi:hypothetical protein
MRRSVALRVGCLLIGVLAFLALRPSQTARAATGFTATGSLGAARYDHTATLLADGKVLIVGGRVGSSTPLGSAELYNPATGQFTPTNGSLSVARFAHGAALLPGGDVLIAGGFADGSGTGSMPMERYSAATGTFTPIPALGALEIPRLFPSVTALADGRVLVAGGYNGGTHLQLAQVFNPNDGMISNTAGLMNDGRSRHSAVLLNNGLVLLAGGWGSSGDLVTAELFDPVSTTFAATPDSLSVARRDATTVLLNDGHVLLAGGLNADVNLATTEIYEPENARFVPGGTMPIGRSRGAGARLQDGRVLIAGGSTPEGTSAKAAIYRPTTNTFTAVGSLQNARTAHTATTLGDGTVLVAAGEDGTPLASAELYTPDIYS